ncbi:MAG: alpha/beta hydrolase, partial [Candidatus Eremiobacteraeota bacterium]|nr:alpha/beta hydrolase [Candidatus Eremiobacteraeota bacterium]
LEAHAKLGTKPIETLSVEEARRQPTIADAVAEVLKQQGHDPSPQAWVSGIKSSDRTIPGVVGELPVRFYTPNGKGPFPVVVYFHGGGWVLADKQIYDNGARGLAKAAHAIVVSVDYRLAPEAKFPAAWDDALAAYQWVAINAASFHGMPKKLALAGESAGGNLALATAVAVVANGGTVPRAVLAVYPVAQTSSVATESYTDCATAKPLNRAMIGWFLDKLLANPADKVDTRLDIVHARLNGLPPVTIIDAQIDPLRTDGVLLELALKTAGVTVNRKEYTGVTHEFFGTAAVVAKAKDAQIFAGEELKRLLWD